MVLTRYVFFSNPFRAVKDCQFVIHVASPFPNQTVANPEEELIKPAVEGTKHVLKACAESKTVQRVVLTSSVAAIHGEWLRDQKLKLLKVVATFHD